ncbi:MAG: Zn-ribbon domain-containing OB-fold protein [Thermodesulfobacteriota bacterium]
MSQKITYARYQQALEEGRLAGLRCRACQQVTFPPQTVCRVCGGRDFSETELGGRGTIRTFTVIRVAPEGRKPPYIVALAELEEGPWVIGRLEGLDPQAADMGLIGRPVTLGSQMVEGDVYSPACRVLTFTLA